MDDSPFARLPGEIRNKIWRAAIVHPEPIDVAFLTAPPRKTYFGRTETHFIPGLLGTCRAIRSETAGIYYGENTFVIVESVRQELVYSAEKFSWLVAHDHIDKIASLQLRSRTGGSTRKLHDQTAFAAKVAEVRREVLGRPGDEPKEFDRFAQDVLSNLVKVGFRLEAVELVRTPGCWTNTEAIWAVFCEAFEAACGNLRGA